MVPYPTPPGSKRSADAERPALVELLPGGKRFTILGRAAVRRDAAEVGGQEFGK